tara:strand:+ start:266 stop:562 length:297 start_codon:yes stop_codon:yes gene_type:complete
MNTDTNMDVEYIMVSENNLPEENIDYDYDTLQYSDFSLNNTPEDDFMYLIDLAIEHGDVYYIYSAIENYKNVINESYIKWANNLIIQIVEEKIEDMQL